MGSCLILSHCTTPSGQVLKTVLDHDLNVFYVEPSSIPAAAEAIMHTLQLFGGYRLRVRCCCNEGS
jgi:hypothetical protein